MTTFEGLRACTMTPSDYPCLKGNIFGVTAEPGAGDRGEHNSIIGVICIE